jgi:hypothetical protein
MGRCISCKYSCPLPSKAYAALFSLHSPPIPILLSGIHYAPLHTTLLKRNPMLKRKLCRLSNYCLLSPSFAWATLGLGAISLSVCVSLFISLLFTHHLIDSQPSFPSRRERTTKSVGLGGLTYISLGVGSFLGTQIYAPINDRIYCKLKMRNNNIGRPEFRIPLMIPGACLVLISLFIYGWTSLYQTHRIVPNIGQLSLRLVL